ncbi:hypothetical protein SNEBB_008878 [Seison nebaliae]|nr:hypothetical protein SNEBB_008878 [Seison nebaliae]
MMQEVNDDERNDHNHFDEAQDVENKRLPNRIRSPSNNSSSKYAIPSRTNSANGSINGSMYSNGSRLTYSHYPQVRPTNPLYSSNMTIATLKTGVSAGTYMSRGSLASSITSSRMRKRKFDPNLPAPPSDWRWFASLCILLFFPTGIIAFLFALKAKRKYEDGFISVSYKLSRMSFIFCGLSFVGGLTWILTVFYILEPWSRANSG